MQIDDNLLETIVRKYDQLRKSDKRVADVVLDKPSEVVEMTLATISQVAEVSEPTVIRFCSAVGCDGYRDFRVKLAQSLAFARSTSHTAISDQDSLDNVITKIFDYNLSSLKWAQSKIDVKAVSKAIDILLSAKRIEFFGFGASGIVAFDAQQKFPLFGVPCGVPLDTHQMFISAEMLGEGDVVVAISHTGETREVIRAANIACEQGAKVIGLTGSMSPLAKQCDVALVIETLENTDLYTPTVSRLAHLVMIDILSTFVSLHKGEAHQKRIQVMKSHLASLRTLGRMLDHPFD